MRFARLTEQDPERPRRRAARRAGVILVAVALLYLITPSWLLYGIVNGVTGNYRFRSQARMQVSVATEGEAKSTFKVTERGPYSAIVAIGRGSQRYWPRPNDSLPFTVNIRIEAGGRSVARTINRSASSLYGAEGEAIVLAHFEAPSDFPAWKEGTVTFTVVRPSAEFERQYGPLLFYMMLMSDY